MKEDHKGNGQDSEQTFVLMKTCFVFVFRRRLQDVLIKTNIFVLAIRLQDVFKTSSRRLAKNSSRHLRDVFKTFWRRLQDVSQRYLQEVFKTYHQGKLFLSTRLWEPFNTFLRRSFSKTIIYTGICPGNSTSEKFLISAQNLQES